MISHNKLDYINKIKTDLSKELTNNVLFLLKHLMIHIMGLFNPSFISSSTVLFKNAEQMVRNNIEFSYDIHGTTITNDLCCSD